MRRSRFITLWLTIAKSIVIFQASAMAQPQTIVALELALAVDTSSSVDDQEYALQMQGIAAAFRHAAIIAEIQRLGGNGIAVAVIHWSQNYATKTVVETTHVFDAASAFRFADRVGRTPRRYRSTFTSAGAAIVHSIRLLEENGFAGVRRTIDVSGDGRSNAFPLPHGPRSEAHRLGITINGLAIATGDAGLANYYRDEVIAGPGSFVEVAQDYTAIAPVTLRKLLREIAPPTTQLDQERKQRRHAMKGLPDRPQ